MQSHQFPSVMLSCSQDASRSLLLPETSPHARNLPNAHEKVRFLLAFERICGFGPEAMTPRDNRVHDRNTVMALVGRNINMVEVWLPTTKPEACHARGEGKSLVWDLRKGGRGPCEACSLIVRGSCELIC